MSDQGAAGRFWHGSKQQIETFSLTYAGRCENASNGALGVWLACDRDLAARFCGSDGYLHEVAIDEGKVYRLDIGALSAMHNEAGKTGESLDDEIGYYDRFRRALLEQGFVRLDIVESTGAVHMCVALDPERCMITASGHAREFEEDLPSP